MEENEYEYSGPGSGEDDFADYNANEADDYRNEGDMGDEDPDPDCTESDAGAEDSHLEREYEERTDLGD